MKHTLLLLVILAHSLSYTSLAQKSNPEDIITTSIKKNAQAFLKHKEINSVSIGIYKEGITYTQHYGELEKGKGNTPNDETIYEIASVTKTMTGYLVAKAVEEQKLKLDDDIRLYLDNDFPNLEYEDTPITIKHLVTHTSGLPKFIPFELNGIFEKLNKEVPTKYYEKEEESTKQKFLVDLKKVTLTASPGSTYSYFNAGAELIGYILETIYQKK